MITYIVTQSIFVEDQAKAEKFWTEQMGFEIVLKEDMGHGTFQLEVAPPGAQSHLFLYPRSIKDKWENYRPSIIFACEDIHRTYLQLQANGVKITEPQDLAGTKFMIFKDPEGYDYIIKEVKG
ncbi:MAG: VOC family protein [Candidatus Omnitrophica bacterium]|nr:VOC family protein [Candidatus Omnitrophota bacterium]